MVGENSWVLDLLANQGSQINPLALAATESGMSRTTLGQLSDPNILLGTGIFSPEDIQRLLQQRLISRSEEVSFEDEQKYLEAMQDWEDSVASLDVKYRYEEPKFYSDAYATGLQRFNNDPVVQLVFDNLIGDESRGVNSISATAARSKMQQKRSADDWNSLGFDSATANFLIENDIDSIDKYLTSSYGANMSAETLTEFKTDLLNDVARDAGTYRTNYMKWKDQKVEADRSRQAELTALGDAPSFQDYSSFFDADKERLDFFNDIGLGGLALLPDPSDVYRITPEEVLKSSGKDTAMKALKNFAGDPNVERLQREQVRLGDVKNIGGDYGMADVGMLPTSPKVTGKDVAADLLGRLQAGRTEGGRTYQAARQEGFNAQMLADLLTSTISKQGRTPFTDAMEQLYGYGAQV